MKYYILRFLITALIVTPIYLAIRRPWRFKDKREWLLGAFWVYLFCLLSLVFDGVYGNPLAMLKAGFDRIINLKRVNIMPLRSIIGYFNHGTADELWVNIVSNIVIFIPWGFFLPALWKKNQHIIRLPILCLLLTFCIELLQPFVCRNSDIDDILLNFIGGLLGAGVYFILLKLKPAISKYSK